MDAGEVIERLGLVPHPEGGWYRETWRDLPADGGRGAFDGRDSRDGRRAGVPTSLGESGHNAVREFLDRAEGAAREKGGAS